MNNNKYLIITVVIVLLINFINFNNATTVDPIILIVNPNNNNQYNKGSECGTVVTFTCNSINDATTYFKNISSSSPSSSTFTQPLILQLQDGIYSLNQDNIIEIYQFNLTITSFTSSSNNVIFNGFNSSSNIYSGIENTTLISITEPTPTPTPTSVLLSSLGSTSESSVETYLLIENIVFQNIVNQSILNVVTFESKAIISFNGCSFNGFNSTLRLPIIGINMDRTPLKESADSIIQISNSVFSNINEYITVNGTLYPIPVIVGSNSIVQTLNVNVTQSTFGNFIYSPNGIIKITTSNFNSCSSTNGIIFADGSTDTTITNSTFINNNATNYGGAITSTSSEINQSLGIQFSTFINNISPFGGAIYMTNDNSSALVINILSQCTFTNNFATNSGGAIYISGVSMAIYNTLFIGNDAVNFGGTFDIQSDSTFSVIGSSTITPPVQSNIFRGEILYASTSTVSFSGVQFTNSSISNQLFGCAVSQITFTNCIDLDPSFYCVSCISVKVDGVPHCTEYTSFQLSVSTTTTTGNSSNSIIKMYSLFFTFLIISITTLLL